MAYFEAIAKNIGHEFRTSLIAIKSGISGVKDYIPQLIETYQIASKHGLRIPEIQPHHLNILISALDFSEKAALCTSSYLNMFVTNMTELNPNNLTLDICSINECLKETFKQFPYKSNEQQSLINNSTHFKDDFLFKGNKNLIINLLLNLLRYLLYHIQDVAKGHITIWTRTSPLKNFLFIKNTGKGIKKVELSSLFDPFYGTQKHHIGMGLFFSKNLMHALNGDIFCTADEDTFCQFTLSFPLNTITRY